jgi:superfamily II DNA or RNA helicase
MEGEQGRIERGIEIVFEQGTLLLPGLERHMELVPELDVILDTRVGHYRAEAFHYRAVVECLAGRSIPYIDRARAYTVLDALTAPHTFRPYPHQEDAVNAWQEAGMAGLVVMPTGSGKTVVAQMAIAACRRSTLVVVPTLDLMAQWVRAMESFFGVKAGIIGGGEFTVNPISVITYDSAVRHMDSLGNRFGFIVFDEVHHLPGPMYGLIARLCIAPFRMGLTATPERHDGGEEQLERLVGPLAFSLKVSSIAGDVLSPYRTVRKLVDLTPEETLAYEAARKTYTSFCARKGIRMGSPSGWQDFLLQTCRSPEGRQVFDAYQLQRSIPLKSEAKFRVLGDLLQQHRGDRIILFTHVNELAYRISRRHLLPVITHQTPTRERAEILTRFGKGDYPAVVTSRVLNEGVDVPEANVGVVMSGSGSVREHVQRLGRILRKREGKEAVLYEVVARGTHEEGMSQRRRKHEAYRRRRHAEK